MNELAGVQREIVHKGQLQQKITIKVGTLLRKKKSIYEDERWVVLCVHDGRIPHLEWYGESRAIFEHRPLKLQDLLECQYINVAIGEERCICIGFLDKQRPVIELSAPSVEERRQWVTVLTQTLRNLNCLTEIGQEEAAGGVCPRAENEYVALTLAEDVDEPPNSHTAPTSPPVESSSIDVQIQQNETRNDESITKQTPSMPIQRNRVLCLTDTIPMAVQHPSPSNYYVCVGNNKHHKLGSQPSSADANKYIPPVFPKQSLVEQNQSKFVEGSVELSQAAEGSGDEDKSAPPLPPRVRTTPVATPRMPTSPIPSSPPEKLIVTQRGLSDSNSPSTNPCSQYDQICSNQNQYQQVCRFSGEFSTLEPFISLAISSKSNSSSARSSEHGRPSSPPPSQYDVVCPASIPNSLPMDPGRIFTESLARPRKISFLLTLLAEYVAFVELGERVWVAGWNPKADTNLRDILNFGDEVEYINGIRLKSVQQLPEIYATTRPGVQIELVLRSNPVMKVFSLVKPANPKRELGVALHKGKNKIASIERGSPAAKASMSATIEGYFFHPGSDKQVRACITQLNGIPLSPFASNEQLFVWMERVPTGQSVNLAVLPSDFCSQLGKQLKAQLRKWGRFIHE